jgi:hypothetical protein
VSSEPPDCYVPDELVPAVDHIGFLFFDACYRVSLTTTGLCYAMLHPSTAIAHKRAEELTSFDAMLGSVGQATQEQIRDLLGFGTPPALVKAFFEAQCALLRLEAGRIFDELVQVADANKALVRVHPVTWARTHAWASIEGQSSSAERWVIDACDVGRRDLSGSIMSDRIEPNAWLAPKLLNMHPAGPIPYNPKRAWEREDQAETQGLLGMYLETMLMAPSEVVWDRAGDTAVSQAKQGMLAGSRVTHEEAASSRSISALEPPLTLLKGGRASSTSKNAETNIGSIYEENPRDRVDAYLQMMRNNGHKITRKNISDVAGYDDSTEFERFQRQDARATVSAKANFNRVLDMSPEEFMRVLEKKRSK